MATGMLEDNGSSAAFLPDDHPEFELIGSDFVPSQKVGINHEPLTPPKDDVSTKDIIAEEEHYHNHVTDRQLLLEPSLNFDGVKLINFDDIDRQERIMEESRVLITAKHYNDKEGEQLTNAGSSNLTLAPVSQATSGQKTSATTALIGEAEEDGS